jgi:hypothetical protein
MDRVPRMGSRGREGQAFMRRIRELLHMQKPPGHGGSGCGVARGPVRRLEGEADTEFYARTTCERTRRLRPSGPEFCM